MLKVRFTVTEDEVLTEYVCCGREPSTEYLNKGLLVCDECGSAYDAKAIMRNLQEVDRSITIYVQRLKDGMGAKRRKRR